MDEGPPTAGLTADEVAAMSRQDVDQLRREIADHHDVRPRDVEICACGTVHVTLHLVCPGREGR